MGSYDIATREVNMKTADNGDDYTPVSFWFDSLPEPVRPLEPQDFADDIDVAIVGAGFTGLWTAYYLKQAQPELRIAMVEAEVAGFGASGRNGGWCFGESAGMYDLLEKDTGRAIALMRAMFDTVDEVKRVCDAEGIDCHYARGGTLSVAHTAHHARHLEAEVAKMHGLGFTDADYQWLPENEARRRVNTRLNHGALHFKHGAAIHPARLARGLAAKLQKMGVVIHELTPATAIAPGVVETRRGPMRARKIVRATEAYTESLRGQRRRILPLYSLMVATEPLPEHAWAEIGLAHRETFSDGRRMVIYGLRTQDGRLAFGGRSGYDFGSGWKRFVTRDHPGVQQVGDTLRDIFPMLADYRLTHGWGGVLGVSRWWRPAVCYDPATGIGSADGFVGDGVATTNLAARVLRDLMLERDTELITLPWVNDTQPRWEPEPLRWLGYTAGSLIADMADRREQRTGKPSPIADAILDRLAW
jgi:glycine/D-amino acid oxidase-like deaminating enzyme